MGWWDEHGGGAIGTGIGGAIGALGFLTGNPVLGAGTMSAGAGLGGSIGSQFDTPAAPQRVGGFSDKQIEAIIEAQRRRGTASINAATTRGMRLSAAGASTAGTGGLVRSGLLGGRLADIAGDAGLATANLEGDLANMAAAMYANRQYAPPSPGMFERIAPALTQIGAPLIGQALSPEPAPWRSPMDYKPPPLSALDPSSKWWMGGGSPTPPTWRV